MCGVCVCGVGVVWCVGAGLFSYSEKARDKITSVSKSGRVTIAAELESPPPLLLLLGSVGFVGIVFAFVVESVVVESVVVESVVVESVGGGVGGRGVPERERERER